MVHLYLWKSHAFTFSKIITRKAYEWNLILMFGPLDCFETTVLHTKRLYDYLQSDKQPYKTTMEKKLLEKFSLKI